MHVLGTFFLNLVKTDGKTEIRKDGVLLSDVEELTFLKIYI